MGRKKTDLPAVPAKDAAPPSRKQAARAASPSAPTRRLARRRMLAAAVLAVVALAALGGRELWLRMAPQVVHRPRYLIPAEAITLNDPPEWITGDVCAQVIHNANLDRRVSILDPGFVATIEHAFALHPWIESVDRIEKRVPPGVHVDVTYRRPVAAIEVPRSDGTSQLLPVDALGIHLPAEDVPEIRLRYLPRLTGVVGAPPVGQRWDDPRVAGGVELAARLGGEWELLHLYEIAPSARPEILGDSRYFVYELLTGGGTRIVWGPGPHDRVPGEDDFAAKLQRLRQCAQEFGPFDSMKTPEVIDIRRGVTVTPRAAKNPATGTITK